ncbi:MAG: hypothetical protein R2883_02960 [Caldisericia bacterium]
MMMSDVPLISSETIREVLATILKSHDLLSPVVTKEETEKNSLGTKRTFAKIKEGHVKVGNIFILKKDAYLLKIQPIVKRDSKKKKVCHHQTLQLGFGFLFRMIAFKNISIPELKRVEKMLGITVNADIVPFPELGVDVDKTADLVFCREILERH